MRVLIVFAACIAAVLAHETATSPNAPLTGEAVRTEPTFGRQRTGGAGAGVTTGVSVGANIGAAARPRTGGGGASFAVGERPPGRFGGGRWGRGYGWGGRFGRRFGGGWIYPGTVEQVVVTDPSAYGYGISGAGYYGGGIGTTYVQQPPVVVQQPPQVVVAEQPAQVVYTQVAPPETAMVPTGTFVAASAPAAPAATAGGFVATAAAPTSTSSTSTTTATEPGASGFVATAAVPAASGGFVATRTGPTVVAAQAPTVVAAQTPTVIAAQTPTIVAAAPSASASYVTAESLVPNIQYASPYFFGAGSPVVYSRYLSGPTSWYAFRGRRFGRRFGSGVFGVYPYGYGSGGVIYRGGGGILGNILGGVTGGAIDIGLPPVYVEGRFGGRGRFGRGRGPRRLTEQKPQPAPAPTPAQGQTQALHQVGNVQSLPTTTITSVNPSSDIMQLSSKAGEQQPAPAPTPATQPLMTNQWRRF